MSDRHKEKAREIAVVAAHEINGDRPGGHTRAANAITTALAEEREAGRREGMRRAAEQDYFASLVALARAAATKASRKFPQPNYVTLKIAEEAGEVVRGAVHYAEGRMDWKEVEGEIVQLLAMLIRFVTEGDQINGVVPPAILSEAGIAVTDK